MKTPKTNDTGSSLGDRICRLFLHMSWSSNHRTHYRQVYRNLLDYGSGFMLHCCHFYFKENWTLNIWYKIVNNGYLSWPKATKTRPLTHPAKSLLRRYQCNKRVRGKIVDCWCNVAQVPSDGRIGCVNHKATQFCFTSKKCCGLYSINICVYTHTHISMYVYVYMCVCVICVIYNIKYIYTHIYIYTHTYTVSMYVCIYMYICVYIYIYITLNIYTYIIYNIKSFCTRIYTCMCVCFSRECVL